MRGNRNHGTLAEQAAARLERIASERAARARAAEEKRATERKAREKARQQARRRPRLKALRMPPTFEELLPLLLFVVRVRNARRKDARLARLEARRVRRELAFWAA